jgi:uncharacterized protein (TIGR02301 family)
MLKHFLAILILLSACHLVPARAQDAAAPFDGDLQRLAEILGTLHYLRGICGTNEGAKWRNEMQALIDAETPSGERRARMIAGFNRGYNGFQQTYRTCTPAASIAIRHIEEGLKIRATSPRAVRIRLTAHLIKELTSLRAKRSIHRGKVRMDCSSQELLAMTIPIQTQLRSRARCARGLQVISASEAQGMPDAPAVRVQCAQECATELQGSGGNRHSCAMAFYGLSRALPNEFPT